MRSSSTCPRPGPGDAVPVTRRFIVTGRVQGVTFRHGTRVEAERLAVDGRARNLPDGSVEVIACGTADAVEQLRRWLHRGPPAAHVANVEEDPGGGETDQALLAWAEGGFRVE